eukprot:6124715-Pyramimonas_sp.AAC.1
MKDEENITRKSEVDEDHRKSTTARLRCWHEVKKRYPDSRPFCCPAETSDGTLQFEWKGISKAPPVDPSIWNEGNSFVK